MMMKTSIYFGSFEYIDNFNCTIYEYYYGCL